VVVIAFAAAADAAAHNASASRPCVPWSIRRAAPIAPAGQDEARSPRCVAQLWWAYARLVRQGRRSRPPTEDTLQVGGDFVVGRDWPPRLRLSLRGPDDRPSVDELLAAVRLA
jgi:hypothetical protein